jgi:hypothetical protein
MKRPLVSRRYDRYRKSPNRDREPLREERAPSNKKKREKQGGGIPVIAAIREYLSDILGSFMPGIYFSLNLLISTVLLLFMVQGLKWHDLDSIAAPQIALFQVVAPFTAFVFCLFSYIIGSAFCRKDIKEPDTASAIRTYLKSSDEEKKGLAFDFEKPVGNPFNLLTGLYMRMNFRVDFPYSHLKRYLNTRNYTHLAQHIPWEGSGEDAKHRSKMFINILKVRLHHYAPLEMPEIEKNEAHIRLMNSLWYVAKAIKNIAIWVLTGIGLAVVAFVLCLRLSPPENVVRLFLNKLFFSDFIFCLALFSVIQLVISWYIRRSIKQYFHYMRVREIMFILEIADTVSRSTGIDMFEGLWEDTQSARFQGELLLKLHANVQADAGDDPSAHERVTK